MTFRIGPTPLVTLSRRTLLRGPGLRAPMLLIRSGEVEVPLPGSRTTHGVVHVGDGQRRSRPAAAWSSNGFQRAPSGLPAAIIHHCHPSELSFLRLREIRVGI
jgi:hypothetical protein